MWERECNGMGVQEGGIECKGIKGGQKGEIECSGMGRDKKGKIEQEL